MNLINTQELSKAINELDTYKMEFKNKFREKLIEENVWISLTNEQRESVVNIAEQQLQSHNVISSYIYIIKLADKIINGDKSTFGMINCLDHYYNGAFNDDLQKLDELKSIVGL